MNDEIKEILDRIETASEIFDCLLKPEECTELLDYITNLQQEKEDYKSRCEKADNQLKIIMQIIKEQPTRNIEDDEWLENRLIGVANILQNGSDTIE